MNELKVLYDLGYQEVTKLETIEKVVKALGAVLVDVRFSPASRNASFRKEYLQKKLGSGYLHVPDLGNSNYRGGEIKFVNIDAGANKIIEILKNRPVILMCACWKRTECHRLGIVNFMQEMYGVPSIPLTKALSKEIVDQNNPTQFGLFDEMTEEEKVGDPDPRNWEPGDPGLAKATETPIA